MLFCVVVQLRYSFSAVLVGYLAPQASVDGRPKPLTLLLILRRQPGGPCPLCDAKGCRAGQGVIAIDPGEPLYPSDVGWRQTSIGLPSALVARLIGVTAFPSAT